MDAAHKPRIALVSVLKPVDDPRMYEKFANTLSGRYEVHVVGRKVRSITSTSFINLIPLPDFHRKGWGRLKAYFYIWRQLKRIRPDLLIIHAAELLPLAFLFRVKFGKKALYDIRENYALNITSQRIYSPPFNLVLGWMVRLAERFSLLFVAHYFLAEQSYVEELLFLKERATVLQNKYQPFYPLSTRRKIFEDEVRCLFVGTISEVYGAREAVGMVIRLREAGYSVSLTLAGQVIEKPLGVYLSHMEAKYPFITLKRGNPLLSHQALLQEMTATDFVVLSYRPHPSTERCIPTKMFECLAAKIPMIVQKNPYWERLCLPYKAAIFINFDKFSPDDLFSKMEGYVFYEGVTEIRGVFWEEEAPKLLQVVGNILC